MKIAKLFFVAVIGLSMS